MPATFTPQPLTAAAFAPFGAVVAARPNSTQPAPLIINSGNTERFNALAEVELSDPDDRAIISIFRGQPRQLPLQIELLEKHPLGSQCFYPLSGEPYLVLVAPGGDTPDLDGLQLFLAQPDQGVQYARNTWHHPLLALHKACDFLVVDRDGAGANCDEYFIPEADQLAIDLGR